MAASNAFVGLASTDEVYSPCRYCVVATAIQSIED
jgi:hypothetical protein